MTMSMIPLCGPLYFVFSLFRRRKWVRQKNALYFILRRGFDFEIFDISRYQMPTVKIITNLDSKNFSVHVCLII